MSPGKLLESSLWRCLLSFRSPYRGMMKVWDLPRVSAIPQGILLMPLTFRIAFFHSSASTRLSAFCPFSLHVEIFSILPNTLSGSFSFCAKMANSLTIFQEVVNFVIMDTLRLDFSIYHYMDDVLLWGPPTSTAFKRPVPPSPLFWPLPDLLCHPIRPS